MQLAIYRDYLALRAVVVAVLGDSTPAIMAAQALDIVGYCTDENTHARYTALETAWQGIACQE